MNTNKKRLNLTISGMVQGVFFRSETQKRAEKTGISGWIKNLKDGNVEIVAEGGKKELEEFEKWCGKGPALAKIEKIEKQEQPATGKFKEFEIKY